MGQAAVRRSRVLHCQRRAGAGRGGPKAGDHPNQGLGHRARPGGQDWRGGLPGPRPLPGAEQTRLRLERIRRVAPLLATLRDREQANWRHLGAVIPLPPEAGQQLGAAELDYGRGKPGAPGLRRAGTGFAARIAEIHPDAALLARQADIQALSEQRQQLRNHPSDIGKRQEEVLTALEALEGLARQLGWPVEGEEALERRLPSALVRSATAALIRCHDTLTQAR